MAGPIELRIPRERSRKLVEQLRGVMPGGDTRSATWYPPYPLALARGEGCRVVDHDGNTFIDLLNNFTALVHGHSPAPVREAIERQAPLGTVFPAPGEGQARLAGLITERFDSVELLRFTNSGTEATMMAVQTARAFTGRDRVVKIHGGYHGSWEQLPMVWADGGRPPRGVSAGAASQLDMAQMNDSPGLEALMAARGCEIAAIIIEPVMGEGVVAASADFLKTARDLADEHGALLIFDEVITARLGFGGRQGEVGVMPDLTAFGKMIGGGLPVGAFGGRRDVMEIYDPARPDSVPHSGTFNGNPMTVTAGIAAMEMLSAEAVERLNRLGDNLAATVEAALADGGLPGLVTSCGSLVNVHFDIEAASAGEITRFADLRLESDRLAAFHLACLDEGLFIANRGLMAVSTPMDDGTVAEIGERVAQAARRVAKSFD